MRPAQAALGLPKIKLPATSRQYRHLISAAALLLLRVKVRWATFALKSSHLSRRDALPAPDRCNSFEERHASTRKAVDLYGIDREPYQLESTDLIRLRADNISRAELRSEILWRLRCEYWVARITL